MLHDIIKLQFNVTFTCDLGGGLKNHDHDHLAHGPLCIRSDLELYTCARRAVLEHVRASYRPRHEQKRTCRLKTFNLIELN
jgi:hypothetical protein